MAKLYDCYKHSLFTIQPYVKFAERNFQVTKNRVWLQTKAANEWTLS